MRPTVSIVLGPQFIVYAGLLFVSAGTLDWPAAWALLFLFFGLNLLITRTLARDDPASLDEWMRPLIQKGQPLWDKIIMPSLAVLLAFWMSLMGFDAGRFH